MNVAGGLIAPAWQNALEALRSDLLAPGGPRISTMRNHRFAILPYPPAEEFPLRRAVAHVVTELRQSAWQVREVSVQKLVTDRLARLDPQEFNALRDRERRLFQRSPERARSWLVDTVSPMLEGTQGIAHDVVAVVDQLAGEHPNAQDRSVVIVSRLSALHPFTRPSVLLKHLAGRTQHISVVLLYPGERQDNGLSFLGRLEPDRDYRPRIYA